jgi:cellulose synthase (UDP-forming)
VASVIRASFGERVIGVIHQDQSVGDALANDLSVLDYESGSQAANDFRACADKLASACPPERPSHEHPSPARRRTQGRRRRHPGRPVQALGAFPEPGHRGPFWSHPVAQYGTGILAFLLFCLVISVPLDLTEQAIFASTTFAVALLLRRTKGRVTTLAMMTLSISASSRYIWWRLTDTVGFENPVDAFFGFGLVAAELYAFSVLLIGYFQTIWPLGRRPVPLPADTALWPSVDVFIPTYNEPLEVVKQTVFSAMSLDWPADKLKVFVLDDGRRSDFRKFCEEVGVGYKIRGNNRHAKAGNINAALASTDGEYVAIFDCDHIPTRSFLQVCMGWFLKDSKMAMLQTPHVFFSPDPFEKNLDTFRRTPNEGELFYGVVQDGNDLWNASFFCGSCAIIKRAPLLEVGGVAIETVTEDAHTALKLHRKGYNTAYLESRRPPAWPPKACRATSASASAGRAAWRRSGASTTRCSARG